MFARGEPGHPDGCNFTAPSLKSFESSPGAPCNLLQSPANAADADPKRIGPAHCRDPGNAGRALGRGAAAGGALAFQPLAGQVRLGGSGRTATPPYARADADHAAAPVTPHPVTLVTGSL